MTGGGRISAYKLICKSFTDHPTAFRTQEQFINIGYTVRSQVRLPMRSLDFSIDLILLAAWLWDRLSL
jgi:hypothetical protein